MNIELWENTLPWEKLENEWEALLAESNFQTPFLTPTWYKVWFNHFGNPLGLKVLLGNGEKGDLLGLGILREEQEGKAEKKISLLGNKDLWDYRDFLIRSGQEAEFFEKLANFFQESPWHILEFNGISEFSPTLKFLPPIMRAKGLLCYEEVEEVSLYLNLPSSWEEFLKNLKGKDRHELRRKIRRLRKERDFEIKKVASSSWKEEIELFFSLHRKSGRDKAEFMNAQMESFFRELAAEFLKEGWLNLTFLKIKGKEAAVFFSFDFQGSEYLYNSGYDPDLGHFSPGIVLAAFSIEEAIQEGKKQFNFLRGREEYKYRLGGKEERIYRLRVEKR